MLKVRSALEILERLTYTSVDEKDRPGLVRFRGMVEKLRLDPAMHQVNELQAWHDCCTGRVNIDPDQLTEVERLFAPGTAARKLGHPGADPAEAAQSGQRKHGSLAGIHGDQRRSQPGQACSCRAQELPADLDRTEGRVVSTDRPTDALAAAAGRTPGRGRNQAADELERPSAIRSTTFPRSSWRARTSGGRARWSTPWSALRISPPSGLRSRPAALSRCSTPTHLARPSSATGRQQPRRSHWRTRSVFRRFKGNPQNAENIRAVQIGVQATCSSTSFSSTRPASAASIRVMPS